MADRIDHEAEPGTGTGAPQDFQPDIRALFGVAMVEATNRSSVAVEAEHLMLALLFDRNGQGTKVLAQRGLTYEAFSRALLTEREHTLAAIGITVPDASRLTAAPRIRRERPRFSASARDAWERAGRRARSRRGRAQRFGSLDVFAGLLSAELGTVPRALLRGGFDREELLAAVEAASQNPRKDNS